MSFNKIVPQLWMMQPKEIRDKVAADLSLPKTGVSEIRDQEVISDGYCQADLDHITLERMSAYIGSVESFPRAWEISCMKAYSELHPPLHFIGTTEQLAEIEASGKPVTPEQLANLIEVSNDEFTQITGQAIPKVEPKSTNTTTHASRKTKKSSSDSSSQRAS